MTKFAILMPLKSKEMEQVTRALSKILSIFGVPRVIRSDNGSEFVNDFISQLTTLTGIDHRTISQYSPRANGAV